MAAPLKLAAVFVVLTGVPLASLGWLGWRLLEQDRALETQRLRERIGTAANEIAREVDRRLAAWEAAAAGAASGDESLPLPDGTVAVFIDAEGAVHWRRGVRLPYYPHVPSASVPSALLASAEAHEFQEGDLARAAAAYRALASSKGRAVRAVALTRLARVLRKAERLDEALAVYRELAALDDAPVGAFPAGLIARRERMVLLTALGHDERAADEAEQLASALGAGRFAIDRPTFEFFSETAPIAPGTGSVAAGIRLAEAAGQFWEGWREQPRGRTGWSSDGDAFVTAWRRVPAGTAAIVGPVRALLASAVTPADDFEVSIFADVPGGGRIWGGGNDVSPAPTRTLRDAGLPWNLQIAVRDPAAPRALAASRRNLYATGFALMAVVIGAAGYFVFRAVNRELGVARLQSDFVAAVSHEFRTPLTAMCHLTEMLEDGAAPVARLPEYHRALGRESRRLHAMVEHLLDFGRIEAGQHTYEFAVVDATDLVTRLVEESREQLSSGGHRLEVRAAPASVSVRADRDALTLAVRNLLENAVKYSPPSTHVGISVKCERDAVRISVDDEGPGISREERAVIFRKFARGAAARALNVKGTGIGLALVDEIVKAHHGRVDVRSEPGHGSTFTIALPRVT